MSNPYTYQVTHLSERRKYIGVRLNNKLPAREDLGKLYFTSSKHKIFRQEAQEYPEHFFWEVLEEFDNRKEAIEAERKLLESIPTDQRALYYNKCFHTGGTLFIDKSGDKNPRFGRSLRVALIQKYGEEEGSRRFTEAMQKSGAKRKGKKFTAEHSSKIAQASSWYMSSQENKERISKMWKGKKRSEETKHKNSESHKGLPATKGAWSKGHIPWNKGEHHSEETHQKMKEAAAKRKERGDYRGHPATKESIQKMLDSRRKNRLARKNNEQ